MALHRFVHVGDLHQQSTHPRNGDRLASLDQIIAHGEQRAAAGELAAWCLPGDLFHTRSTADDRNALAARLQRMAFLAPVVITAGNHDAPGDLDIFARLDGAHPLVVATQPRLVGIDTGTGVHAWILCLPYAHKAGLVGAGVEHTQLPQVAAGSFDAILIALGDDLQHHVDAGEPCLVNLHQNIAGAVSSVGQPQIGSEIEYSTALLDRLPADAPILANHIHKHQVMARTVGLPAVFAGSTSRHDYGEMEEKGFVEWTLDDLIVQLDPGDGWSWQFLPLNVPQQFQVEGTLDREYFEITRVNGEPADQRPNWKGSDVRVRYEYQKAAISTLDTAKILAEFADVRSLKLEGVPVAIAEVRAPEVIAAVTLDAKVEALCVRQGIAWTPGIVEKLSALQQDDAADIIAAWADAGAPVAILESAVA